MATKRRQSEGDFAANIKRRRNRDTSPTDVTCPMGSYASLFRTSAPAPLPAIPVLAGSQNALLPPPPLQFEPQVEAPQLMAPPLDLPLKAPKSPDEDEYLAAGKVSYTQWRNERRKQGRRNVNMMLAHLDEILPKTFQSSPSPNGAGGRAVGAQGRSLHDVLNDTVRYLQHFKQEALHKAHGVERAEAVKGSLTSAKSVLCVEVEGGKGDSCTITGLGEGAKSFFNDPRARLIGDVITVNVSTADAAKLSNTTSRSRANSENASMDNLFGLEKAFPSQLDPSSLVKMGSDLSNTGTGAVARSESINLTLAALVAQVLPNGNLVIDGHQQVRVNNELRDMRVSGIVRREDITQDNTVNLTQIAEARISYGGRGIVSDVQQPRYGSQLLDIIMPW